MKKSDQVYQIGVLGGMGSLATSYFLDLIFKNTQVQRDQDHLNVVLLNRATTPDRTELILKGEKEPLLSQLTEDITTLEQINVDYVCVPCNTLMYWHDDLQAMTDIPIINIVNETVKHVISQYPKIKKIGVLGTQGTIESGLYDKEFARHGVECIHPDSVAQQSCTDIIYRGVKSGEHTEPQQLFDLVEDLHDQGAQLVLLGCTELSVAAKHITIPDFCLDPLLILAQTMIKHAGKQVI